MCYHLLGFFTYFEWKRFAINKQIKHELKHAVPEDKLIQFHFTHHEINQLKWVKSHEFILNGHYYDVLKKIKKADGFFFRCISDDQETVLFKQLRSMTSFNLSQMGNDHPVQVWFKFLTEPMELNTHTSVTMNHSFENRQTYSLSLLNHYSNPFLFIETPPPDVV